MFFVAGNIGSQIWEDGTLKVSKTTPLTRVNAANGFYLGRFGNDGARQLIVMSSVGLWNRCLSASEIIALTEQPYRMLGRTNAARILPISGPSTGTSSVTAAAATMTATGTYAQAQSGGNLLLLGIG
jgi:hypothetical protein